MDIVVAYDIADTDGSGAARLRTVASICESFGIRAQFSVFECRLSPVALARLFAQLEEAIDPRRDSVHIYSIQGGIERSRTTIGITKHHEVRKPWLF